TVMTFVYNSNGLLNHSLAPGSTAYLRYLYDSWGNLDQIEQVANPDSTIVMANYFRDRFGRDSIVESKIVVQVSGGVTKWQWRRSFNYLSLLNQVDSTILLRTDSCNDPCTSPIWPSLTDTSHTLHTRF